METLLTTSVKETKCYLFLVIEATEATGILQCAEQLSATKTVWLQMSLVVSLGHLFQSENRNLKGKLWKDDQSGRGLLN